MHAWHGMDGLSFFFVCLCATTTTRTMGGYAYRCAWGFATTRILFIEGGPPRMHSFMHSRIERDGFVLAGRDGTGRVERDEGCWIRMMTMEMMMTDEMFDVKRSI